MEGAKEGDTVKVHYKGTLSTGDVFDQSTGGEPLQFRLGDKNIIPGFMNAVMGMKTGDKKQITIPSDEAYGPHLNELVSEISKEHFPEDLTLEIGQKLELKEKEGESIVVTVTKISEEGVTIDANHPLAGKDLIFDIELVAIN